MTPRSRSESRRALQPRCRPRLSPRQQNLHSRIPQSLPQVRHGARMYRCDVRVEGEGPAAVAEVTIDGSDQGLAVCFLSFQAAALPTSSPYSRPPLSAAHHCTRNQVHACPSIAGAGWAVRCFLPRGGVPREREDPGGGAAGAACGAPAGAGGGEATESVEEEEQEEAGRGKRGDGCGDRGCSLMMLFIAAATPAPCALLPPPLPGAGRRRG